MQSFIAKWKRAIRKIKLNEESTSAHTLFKNKETRWEDFPIMREYDNDFGDDHLHAFYSRLNDERYPRVQQLGNITRKISIQSENTENHFQSNNTTWLYEFNLALGNMLPSIHRDMPISNWLSALDYALNDPYFAHSLDAIDYAFENNQTLLTTRMTHTAWDERYIWEEHLLKMYHLEEDLYKISSHLRNNERQKPETNDDKWLLEQLQINIQTNSYDYEF